LTARVLVIRESRADDASGLLALFDEAVAWMVARGQPEQWGVEPWSAQPERIARVERFALDVGMRIAELEGVVVGALGLGEAPAYVPAAERPELYVRGSGSPAASR
jgi:hypothetical protein